MNLALNEHMYSLIGFCVIKRHVRNIFVRSAHLAGKCDERLVTQLISLFIMIIIQSIAAALMGNTQSFFCFFLVLFFLDCPKT